MYTILVYNINTNVSLDLQAAEKFDGPELGDEPYEPVDSKSLRRGGMPYGDDIYVAHVNLENIKKMIYSHHKR